MFTELLQKQLTDVQEEFKLLKRTNNPNQRKQQLLEQNLKKLSTIIEENKDRAILMKYIYLSQDLNKQQCEIHKERHFYQLWKIQQQPDNVSQKE